MGSVNTTESTPGSEWPQHGRAIWWMSRQAMLGDGYERQGRCGLADCERSSDETWHEYLHRRGLLRPDGDLPTGTEMVEMLDAQAQARAAANHPDLVETDEERPNEIQQPDSGTDQD
jgi:hypothetical protein